MNSNQGLAPSIDFMDVSIDSSLAEILSLGSISRELNKREIGRRTAIMELPRGYMYTEL